MSMNPKSSLGKLVAAAAIVAASLLLSGCRGAKLSTANEQMERGEYFDAANAKSVRNAAKWPGRWPNATDV